MNANSPDVPQKGPSRVLRSALQKDDGGAEITVHLKVSYKTILLAVVIFDVIHLSLREFIDAGWLANAMPF